MFVHDPLRQKARNYAEVVITKLNGANSIKCLFGVSETITPVSSLSKYLDRKDNQLLGPIRG